VYQWLIHLKAPGLPTLFDIEPNLPLVLKTHNLFGLVIFAGLMNDIKARPGVFDNFRKIDNLHKNVEWRYKVADVLHKSDSDKLNEALFHPKYGVLTWLGL